MFNFGLKGLNEWFILGKKGPMIKKEGDKIAFKNHDDSALINVQALDPVDVQDVITKQYFDDNTSLVPYQTCLSLYSKVLYTDASKQIGTLDVPNLGLIYAVQIKVITPFDGTNPVVTIGTDTNNDRLMTLSENDLKETGIFYLTLSDIFSASETIKAFVTPDSSTQGEIDVTVLYTISEEAPIYGLLFDNSFKSSTSVISNNSLTVADDGVLTGSFNHKRTYMSPAIDIASGKFYMELNLDEKQLSNVCATFHILNAVNPTTFESAFPSMGNAQAVDLDNNSYWLYGPSSYLGVNVSTGLPNPVVNTKITVAIDLDNSKVWFGLDGQFGVGNDPITNQGGISINKALGTEFRISAGVYNGSPNGASYNQYTVQTTPTYPVTGFTNLGA